MQQKIQSLTIKNYNHWCSKEVLVIKLFVIENFRSLNVWQLKMGFGRHKKRLIIGWRLKYFSITTRLGIENKWRPKLFLITT